MGRFTAASWVDRVGSLGSILCAIHCLFMAVAPGLLAVLGLTGPFGHRLMALFLPASVLLGCFAALNSYRVHRSLRISSTFGVCVIGLLVSHQMHGHHEHGVAIGFAVVAGLGLAITHLVNLRTCRRCAETAPAP